MRERGNKVSMFHSLGRNIFICVLFTMILTSAIILWTVIPIMRDNTDTTTENYLSDMSIAYGETLERAIDVMGTEKALQLPILTKIYNEAKIKSSDASYVYVTDPQGTMLYHPNADKIGKPVENEAIQKVIKDLQEGKTLSNDYITYEYNGDNKIASYFIGRDNSYVVVLTADEGDIYKDYNRLIKRSVTGTLFSLGVCSVLGIALVIFITRPIKSLTDNINQLASLDFTKNSNNKLDKRKDETGVMYKAVGALRDELQNVFSEISSNSKQLYTTSEILKNSAEDSTESVSQVERAINEVAEGASSQAQETQRATDNVILIGNMIEETSKQVEQLNSNAQAMKLAGDGAIETLKQLDETNAKTKKAIDNIYAQTITTNESATKIREATGMITSIASETNLLSLNASIEAARAGEQGKGFAVVAAQIQKLAEQSNESTKLIEDIIESLIHDSDEAVQIMTEVKEVIEEQNANVEKTGAGFEEVKQGIDASMDSMKEIHACIEKMDEARVNVVDVVQSLTAIAEENAAATEETSASASEVSASIHNMAEQTEQLENVANQLENSMSKFKLD